jgi:hypothetical protein
LLWISKSKLQGLFFLRESFAKKFSRWILPCGHTVHESSAKLVGSDSDQNTHALPRPSCVYTPGEMQSEREEGKRGPPRETFDQYVFGRATNGSEDQVLAVIAILPADMLPVYQSQLFRAAVNRGYQKAIAALCEKYPCVGSVDAASRETEEACASAECAWLLNPRGRVDK